MQVCAFSSHVSVCVFVSMLVFNVRVYVRVLGLGPSVKVCRGQPEASKRTIYATDGGDRQLSIT